MVRRPSDSKDAFPPADTVSMTYDQRLCCLGKANNHDPLSTAVVGCVSTEEAIRLTKFAVPASSDVRTVQKAPSTPAYVSCYQRDIPFKLLHRPSVMWRQNRHTGYLLLATEALMGTGDVIIRRVDVRQRPLYCFRLSGYLRLIIYRWWHVMFTLFEWSGVLRIYLFVWTLM